jgi:hypothetical protein
MIYETANEFGTENHRKRGANIEQIELQHRCEAGYNKDVNSWSKSVEDVLCQPKRKKWKAKS